MSHEDLKALGSNTTQYQFDHPDPDLLERFPAPGKDEDKYSKSAVLIRTDEFTSLCPKTGQPDWAEIIIFYKPENWCVESKSLKLYFMGFRNHGEFHESCVKRIKDDLVNLLQPTWLVVQGRFTPRGGIPFWPVAAYSMFGPSHANKLVEDALGDMLNSTKANIRKITGPI